MLGIGDVTERTALIFNAVASRAIGVIEQGGLDLDPGIVGQAESVARPEILEGLARNHGFQRHREIGILHLIGKDIGDLGVGQMPGHDVEFTIWMERRCEKRKTVDVIPMGMGEHHRGETDILAQQPMAEIAHACSCIQDDPATAARDLDTARVAAECNVVRGWTGNAAPNAPKLHLERHKGRFPLVGAISYAVAYAFAAPSI